MSRVARPPALLARAVHLSAVSAASVAAAVVVHLASGTDRFVTCAALLALLGVASVATGLASACAQRTRGSTSAVLVLAAGQSLMMALLAAPSSVHGPMWTPTTAVLHSATTIALGALLLGGERVAGDAARWADAVLPRCCTLFTAAVQLVRSSLVAPGHVAVPRARPVGPRAPRGPPLLG